MLLTDDLPPMICSQCAAEMPEISAFCPVCGHSVNALAPVRADDPGDAIWGALAYVGVLPAVVFLALPALRHRRFVSFHCWQSVFFAVATAAAAILMKLLFAILSILPVVGFLLAWLSVGVAFIAVVVMWVAVTIKAMQGQSYELPLIGRMAAQLAP